MSTKIERILLCFDGSDAASKAFEAAVEMAVCHHAILHLLVVAPTLELGVAADSAAVTEHSRAHHASLLHALSQRDFQGVEAHAQMLVGNPAQKILEQAASLEADVIVVGHRGHGVFDRWRLGSVTHRIISYAECAVLVVR